MQKYNSRKDVPEKYKWNLTDFFKDEQDFNDNYDEAVENIAQLEKFKDCTKDASELYEFLCLEVKTSVLCDDLYVYSFLLNDQELGIKENIERKNKTVDLYSKFSTSVSFFAPELLKLSREDYDNLFIQDERLKEFKSLLDQIYRQKKHVLSDKEEQIIILLANSYDNFSDISSNMLNREHNYGKVKLEDGTNEIIASNNYRHLMQNKNRNIRKKVYTSYNKKIDEYSTTSAGLLNSYAKGNNTIAQIHNFKNAWDQKLFSLNLSDKVFKTLINTVEENTSSLQNYYNFKKEVLGYNELYYYDTKVNMTNFSKEYSIEDAQNLVLKAVAPLKDDYVAKMKKIFDNRYIDYCQYKGKCSGGYSFATSDKDSRILMSFTGNLDSVSTIAHEGGHNVHSQYSMVNPLQYRGATSTVAEVASLTNECLLSSYLARNGKTKEEKLAGIENIINIINSNLFGAVREGKIEQDMYEEIYSGGTITKDLMDKLVKNSYKKYFGKSVKLDKNIKNSWVIRSHYYMDFYLYSYALSISVAINVASKILDGDEKMLKNYFKFLKTGTDKWPSEIFAILGIDLENKNVYEEAIKYYNNLIEQYKKIYYEEGD